MDEDLKRALEEIKSRISIIEQEIRRYRQIQENKANLAPHFVESSPQIRTYGESITDLVTPKYESMSLIAPRKASVYEDFIYIMGYFDQIMLTILTPIAKKIKIITPVKTPLTPKNEDALKRMQDAGAQVRLHRMLHARIVCAPARDFLVVGSGDIQTDCFGGSRFDAGIYSNHPDVIKDAIKFFNTVWNESVEFMVDKPKR